MTVIKNEDSGVNIDCGKPTFNPTLQTMSGLKKRLSAKISLLQTQNRCLTCLAEGAIA
jgi:hypothetical protein